MENLLHERLQQAADNASPYRLSTVRLANGNMIMLSQREISLLQDEIERYYIPRPRFENGEPVQFDDEYIDHNGHNQTVSSLTYTKGNADYVNVNGWHKQPLNEPLKRPATKVLDADGVEIKVGDTIYYQHTGNEYTVVKLDPKDEYHALLKSSIDGKEQWHCIARFTHHEPDSLEKLRDDMSKYGINFEIASGRPYDKSKYTEFADRLTALMERDA